MFLTLAAFNLQGSIVSGLLPQTVCSYSDAEMKNEQFEFEFNRMFLTVTNRQMVWLLQCLKKNQPKSLERLSLPCQDWET